MDMRSKQFHIRLTPEEAEKTRAFCHHHRVSASDFFRAAAFDRMDEIEKAMRDE